MQQKRTLTPAEKWEQATLANNFIFCKVMAANTDLCRELLEILLHIKIERIEPPLSEKSVKIDFDAHGIRLDVYTKDDNREFDIEVQTTTNENLPKRARYYQSLIDVDNLATGEDYSTLKESYVIFLCLEDIFKKGLPVYRFENICTENTAIKLEDKAYKVFFNAEQCDIMPTDEEKAFFRYLQGKIAETDFTRKLATEVERAKQNAQWRSQFMTWNQSIKEEARILAKELAVDMATDLAKDMAADMAKDMAKNMATDLAKNMATDIAKDMATDMAKDMVAAMVRKQQLDTAQELFRKGVAVRIIQDTYNLTAEETAHICNT